MIMMEGNGGVMVIVVKIVLKMVWGKKTMLAIIPLFFTPSVKNDGIFTKEKTKSDGIE